MAAAAGRRVDQRRLPARDKPGVVAFAGEDPRVEAWNQHCHCAPPSPPHRHHMIARAFRPRSRRGLHAGGGVGPGPVLRQHRPSRVRADEPPGGGQGRALRTLLPLREVGPPALPRRVPRGGIGAGRRSSGCDGRRRSGRAGHGAAAAPRDRPRPGASPSTVQPHSRRVRRRLGGAARRRPPGLRRHLQRRDQDRRARPADGVPGAVDPLCPPHRGPGRQVAVRRARGGRRPGAAVALRRDARSGVRDLRPLDGAVAGVLPRTASAVRRRLGIGLPVRNPRQGARRVARAAPGGHAIRTSGSTAPDRRTRRCCSGCRPTSWPRAASWPG